MAKAKRYNYRFKIPFCGMNQLRRMKVGETQVFNAGTRSPSGAFGGAKNAAGAASKLGIKIQQRTMALVDPVTYESFPVIVIECLEVPDEN